LDAESKIQHTFRYKAPTKKRGAVMETVKEILDKTELQSPESRIRKMLDKQGMNNRQINIYLSQFKPEQMGGLYERLIKAHAS